MNKKTTGAMAITLREPREINDQTLLELSKLNPGYQFERDAQGRLVVSPTGAESDRRAGEIFGQLREWARAHRWRALTDAEREGFAPICPDAVFEVRSKPDSLDDLRAKMQLHPELPGLEIDLRKLD